MKLTWKPNFSASALHAAEALSLGYDLVDKRVADALKSSALRIERVAIDVSPQGKEAFWSTLVGFASMIDQNRELAQRTLTRLLGPIAPTNPNLSLLTGLITEAEAAYRLLFPKFEEQAALRILPLQEMWSGFGQGLLAHIGRLTEKELLVETAEVTCVQPVLNGFGFAHLDQNRVRIEAVLTNPTPELPEVVRLAWLLAQLNLDVPRFAEAIPKTRLTPLAGLAMLPPVLAAAQIVELSRIDESTVDLAIRDWLIPVPPDVDIAVTLLSWWETYLQTKAEWPIAMLALDRMLISENSL